MILLDTHVILWIEADPKKLSSAAREAIEDPENEVYVSSISAFELALKVRRKLLELPLAPDTWLREVCRQRGFREIAVNSSIASASAFLPEIHRDPCDRILVATALLNRVRLVSADGIIADYPDIEVVW